MIQNPIQVLTTNVNANLVNAGPASGSPAVPTFRALVAGDVAGIAVSSLSGAATNAQLPNGLSNFNSALQNTGQLTAGTSVYLTNSNINLPASPVNGIVVGTTIDWRVALTKNANGTGTFSIIIFMGTNGTTGDTAEVTQSIGTQTAAVDTVLVDVHITFTAVGSSTGSFFWTITPVHQAATATGFGVSVTTGAFTGTVSSLNTTTANLKFGLGIVSATGGTQPTITVPLVQAYAINLD